MALDYTSENTNRNAGQSQKQHTMAQQQDQMGKTKASPQDNLMTARPACHPPCISHRVQGQGSIDMAAITGHTHNRRHRTLSAAINTPSVMDEDPWLPSYWWINPQHLIIMSATECYPHARWQAGGVGCVTGCHAAARKMCQTAA
jgi:hypothetical protein